MTFPGVKKAEAAAQQSLHAGQQMVASLVFLAVFSDTDSAHIQASRSIVTGRFQGVVEMLRTYSSSKRSHIAL